MNDPLQLEFLTENISWLKYVAVIDKAATISDY